MSPNDLLEAPDMVTAEGNHSCSSSVQSTPEIEKKYVHHVYDAIAPHFSATRFAKWPKVAGFLNSLRPGSIVLDAGCGNGKYLGFNPDCLFIGCDISPPLIEICAGRGHEVLVADAVNLPYRDDFGDAAISIAVLHHLSTDDGLGSRKTSHCLTSGLPSVRSIMKSGLNRAVLQYVVNLELFWKALQKLMKTLV
jgi:alkylated DNA repair protein alkB family protein 8